MPRTVRFAAIRSAAILLTFFGAVAAPNLGWAQDASNAGSTVVESTDVAASLYERGVARFELGEWDEAAVLFEEAWRFDPTPALAWNAGRAWHRAGELDVARTWYVRAMRSDDPELDARVAEALATLDADLAARDELESHPGAATSPPPARPGHTRRIVGGTVAAAGVGLLVGGAASGAAARRHHDAASTTDDPDAFDDRVARGRSARSTSVALWTTGLALTGIGGACIAIPTRNQTEVDVAFTGRSASVAVTF